MSPYVVVSPLPAFFVASILCLVNVIAAIAAGRLPETSGKSLFSSLYCLVLISS